MEKTLDRNTLIKALEIYENSWLDTVSEDAAFEPSENFDRKMKRLIKSQNNVYYKATLTRARKVLVIAAAISVLIASLMSVSAVREKVLGFFISHENTYEVTEYDNSNQSDSPGTIERQFTLNPADFPEGYELSETAADDESVMMTLENGDSFITIEQFTKKSYVSASDSDFDAVRTVSFNGTDYIVRTSDDTVMLVWERGGYVFEAVGFIGEDDMLKLASDVSVDVN